MLQIMRSFLEHRPGTFLENADCPGATRLSIAPLRSCLSAPLILKHFLRRSQHLSKPFIWSCSGLPDWRQMDPRGVDKVFQTEQVQPSPMVVAAPPGRNPGSVARNSSTIFAHPGRRQSGRTNKKTLRIADLGEITHK